MLGFGSAALSCAARDSFIGWSREQQYARLIHVANNQRFCLLPDGRAPNLASAVLARALRQLPGDYLAVYGHRVVAVETFTDPSRHTGACYAASGFVPVGVTLGYGRSAGPGAITATSSGRGCARRSAIPPRSCPRRSAIPFSRVRRFR